MLGEVRATQVEAAQQRVQAGYRGELLGMAHDIYGARVSASGHHE
jgi:hypothetical protein